MNSNPAYYKIIIRLGILCFAIFITSVLSAIEIGINIYKVITIVISFAFIVIFIILWFKHKRQKL
ncbi:hypothetical protein [Clostridium sp. OS1-26]|uniref:hypothetical protein n=1 Tax=Clostridium sp. OS1-26 TaxID=3070681 RepID=UPI0027E11F85|nr:hypothetical protein [Clostridium sp. OS1-26]WML37681.1 hypothetical protein RCG18_14300 [Clostridium sp. OS1-26]